MQLDISEARAAELETLREKVDCATRKELFTCALTLFEWVVSEVEQGHVIIAERAGGKRVELCMLSLEAVKKKARAA